MATECFNNRAAFEYHLERARESLRKTRRELREARFLLRHAKMAPKYKARLKRQFQIMEDAKRE